MKILYLDHPEADFLSALVFRGLCEELGAENVIDWPWMPHFHGQVYEGPVPHAVIGHCAPYSWMPKNEESAWSDAQVFESFGTFDLVILASPRAYNTNAVRTLIAKFGRDNFRLAMLDGEDYTTVRWDLVQEFRPQTYFKTSLVPNPLEIYPAQKAIMQHQVRVLPCPLATTLSEPPEKIDKITDVCFLGGGNWRGPRREGQTEDRKPLKPELEKILLDSLPNSKLVLGNVPYEQYLSVVASSKIAVCVSGHGLEPVRTYESMGCRDTLVVREALPQITPWPLVDGQTCATFTSWEQIPEICKLWLQDDEMRSKAARRGFELIWQKYTPRTRAKYILTEAFV